MGMEKVSHIDTGFSGWRDDALGVQGYEDWKASRK
jgi:hypothetical protein